MVSTRLKSGRMTSSETNICAFSNPMPLISHFRLTRRVNIARVDAIDRKERADGVRGGGGASQSSGDRGRGVPGDRRRRVAQHAGSDLAPAGERGHSDRGDGPQWAGT